MKSANTNADRAVQAALLARSAEEAFVRSVRGNAADELACEWAEAEGRWLAAEQAFADAVPTSRAGTLLKLDALFELLRASGAGDDSLEMRHLRAVTSYIVAGSADERDERLAIPDF